MVLVVVLVSSEVVVMLLLSGPLVLSTLSKEGKQSTSLARLRGLPDARQLYSERDSGHTSPQSVSIFSG